MEDVEEEVEKGKVGLASFWARLEMAAFLIGEVADPGVGWAGERFVWTNHSAKHVANSKVILLQRNLWAGLGIEEVMLAAARLLLLGTRLGSTLYLSG